MASVIEIANFALTGLGADPISSLNEQTIGSIVVSSQWAITRRALLRKHTWNFAVQRVDLARSVDAPNHGYLYKYALPTDFIRLLQVFDSGDYKVEAGFINSNSEQCQVKYVADITDTTLWTADFTELMVAKLQSEIAYAITRDKDLTRAYFQLFANKLQDAIFADASEDMEDPIPTASDSLLGVRY